MTKRIALGDRWGVDMRESWSYGSDMKIAGAWAFVQNDEQFEKAVLVTLQESVVDANVPDENGNAMAFSKTMWSDIDGRIGRRILDVCRKEWQEWSEASDPKDTARRSSDTPRESE